MFVIKPLKAEDWEHALFMLSYYHVNITVRSNCEQTSTTYMVIEAEMYDDVRNTPGEEQLQLAEMCFQMNWTQHNSKLCPDCIDHADRFDFCGHLTFGKPINSNAFDRAMGIS